MPCFDLFSHPIFPRAILTSLAGLLLAVGAQTPVRADRLVFLDGGVLDADPVAIAAGVISGQQIPPQTLLADLRSWERNVPPREAAKSPLIVALRGGGRLMATSANIADEKCQITWGGGDKADLPVEAIRSIRIGSEPLPQWDEAISKPVSDFDRLLVSIVGDDGQETVQIVSGLLIAWNEESVSFEWRGAEQKIPRKRIRGVVLAQIGTENSAGHLAYLADGTILAGQIVSLAEGRLEVEIGKNRIAVPWGEVSRVEVRSDRLQFVSDLNPIEVKESAIATLVRPWQRDRSVSGKPLTLPLPQGQLVSGQPTSVSFSKGIGAHARSELTFELPKTFDFLAGTIGIDAATEGRGDCVVSVLGDRKELWKQRIRGGEAPVALKLDVTGVRRLTLLVEPGEDLDLADHVDWCDLRLIRKKGAAP